MLHDYLSTSPSPCRYWNYLRRQLYVLDTYYSSHDKTLNHTMMAAHSYASAVFSGAVLVTALQLLLLLVGLGFAIAAAAAETAGGAAGVYAAASAALGFSSTESAGSMVSGSSSGSSLSQLVEQLVCPAATNVLLNASSSTSGAAALWQIVWCCTGLSTWLFLSSVLSSQAAVWFMVRQVLRLFRVLSPDAEPEVVSPRISWVLLWLGWVLENMLLPPCMLYTCLCGHIMWGRIQYYKQGGKVHKVVHPPRGSHS